MGPRKPRRPHAATPGRALEKDELRDGRLARRCLRKSGCFNLWAAGGPAATSRPAVSDRGSAQTAAEHDIHRIVAPVKAVGVVVVASRKCDRARKRDRDGEREDGKSGRHWLVPAALMFP